MATALAGTPLASNNRTYMGGAKHVSLGHALNEVAHSMKLHEVQRRGQERWSECAYRSYYCLRLRGILPRHRPIPPFAIQTFVTQFVVSTANKGQWKTALGPREEAPLFHAGANIGRVLR